MSLAPASETDPLSWISAPSFPVYGPPALATGSTLWTVSVAWSVSLSPSSSVAVRVRVTGPSSVQLTLAFALVSSSKLQVAPASSPVTSAAHL